MSALDPSAAVAAAYDPSEVPVSNRMLDLVETPQGATALLASLRRLREGGPLHVLVRLHEQRCVTSIWSSHVEKMNIPIYCVSNPLGFVSSNL
jgi:hypothetical protein